jgi:hypothetical protein
LLLHLGWSVFLAFSFPHSFNIELSTFFKPCVSHLFKALYYSSSRALEMEWIGNEGKEVGRREKFWGRERGWKIPRQGNRMCFSFIPKPTSTASSWTNALVAVGSF